MGRRNQSSGQRNRSLKAYVSDSDGGYQIVEIVIGLTGQEEIKPGLGENGPETLHDRQLGIGQFVSELSQCCGKIMPGNRTEGRVAHSLLGQAPQNFNPNGIGVDRHQNFGTPAGCGTFRLNRFF